MAEQLPECHKVRRGSTQLCEVWNAATAVMDTGESLNDTAKAEVTYRGVVNRATKEALCQVFITLKCGLLILRR